MQKELKVFNSVDEILSYSGELEDKSVVFVDENNRLKKYMIKKKSKNLLKYIQNFPFGTRGISFTQGEDGWIVANGTATGKGNIGIGKLPAFTQDYIDQFFKGKKMILFIEREYESGENNTGRIENFGFYNSRKTGYIKNNSMSEKTVIDLDASKIDFLSDITLNIGQSLGTYTNYKFRIQIEITDGDAITQYEKPDSYEKDDIIVFETHTHYIVREFEDDIINIFDLGGKSIETAGVDNYDNKPAFDKYISLIKKYPNKGYKLYIPSGVFLTSPVHVDCNNFIIIGSDDNLFGRTYISALDDQDYIIKIGGTAEVLGKDENGKCLDKIPALRRFASVKNIVFTTCFHNGHYGGQQGACRKTKYLKYGALFLDGVTYSFFDNLFFFNVFGSGLCIRSSWECYFGYLNFRIIVGFDKYGIYAMKSSQFVSGGTIPNISACEWSSLMFEGVSGTYIYAEPGSGFTNNEFGIINAEVNMCISEAGYTGGKITSWEETDNYIGHYLFNGMSRGNTISSICICNNNNAVKAINPDTGETHYFRAVIASDLPDETSTYDRNEAIAVGNISLRPSSGYWHVYYKTGNGLGRASIGNLVIGDQTMSRVVSLKKAKPPKMLSYPEQNGDYVYAYPYSTYARYDQEALSPLKLMASHPGINDNSLKYLVQDAYTQINDPNKYYMYIYVKADVTLFELIYVQANYGEICRFKSYGTGHLQRIRMILPTFNSKYNPQERKWAFRTSCPSFKIDGWYFEPKNMAVPATSISANTKNMYLKVGKTEQLKVTVLPENTTDTMITYVSVDPSICTVDSNGMITAVTEGTTSVIALAGDSTKWVECVIEVNNPQGNK